MIMAYVIKSECHTISIGRLQVNVTLCHQVKMSCHDVHHIMSRTRLSSQMKARSQYLLPVRNSSMVPITKSGPVSCNIAVMISTSTTKPSNIVYMFALIKINNIISPTSTCISRKFLGILTDYSAKTCNFRNRCSSSSSLLSNKSFFKPVVV